MTGKPAINPIAEYMTQFIVNRAPDGYQRIFSDLLWAAAVTYVAWLLFRSDHLIWSGSAAIVGALLGTYETPKGPFK